MARFTLLVLITLVSWMLLFVKYLVQSSQDSPVVSHEAKKKQHVCAAYMTTNELFTFTNVVKFASAKTWSS